jgi:S-methylmethionine-dependent homocysteine/selenocysteine methylase
MINCAHPKHFAGALKAGESWTKRIQGIRANASTKSHAELDESVELDIGNPIELGKQYCEILQKFGNINVIGGCCGTDFRHVEAVSKACIAQSVTIQFETV